MATLVSSPIVTRGEAFSNGGVDVSAAARGLDGSVT